MAYNEVICTAVSSCNYSMNKHYEQTYIIKVVFEKLLYFLPVISWTLLSVKLAALRRESEGVSLCRVMLTRVTLPHLFVFVHRLTIAFPRAISMFTNRSFSPVFVQFVLLILLAELKRHHKCVHRQRAPRKVVDDLRQNRGKHQVKFRRILCSTSNHWAITLGSPK